MHSHALGKLLDVVPTLEHADNWQVAASDGRDLCRQPSVVVVCHLGAGEPVNKGVNKGVNTGNPP